MRFLIPLLLLVAASHLSAQEADNRALRPAPLFSTRDIPPDDQSVLAAIAESKNERLHKALRWGDPAFMAMRLVFNKRLALQDGDYFLCLFDPSGRCEPGNNPRVLVLLTTNYQIKTWGEFLCEPGFGYGTIVHPFYSPDRDSYFVTVNPQGRNGGMLWFEKYRIRSERIEKLGEGPELTKIPDP